MSDGSPARPLVAIDGPSGVGKGTTARLLARRLGLPYFDTGAMYRALALAVLDAGVDPTDREAALDVIEGATVELVPTDGQLEVFLDGEPVEERIRTPEVGEAASTVSAYPPVRRRMVELQRRSGERYGGVMEGRDIGTRVFPETPFKFFLDADVDVRIERRVLQMDRQGRDVSPEEIRAEMTARDRRDRTREDSPLKHDDTYEVIDTSRLSVDEVVERMERSVRSRSPETH